MAKRTRKKKEPKLKIEHRRLQDLPAKKQEQLQVRGGRATPYTSR